MKLTEVQNQFFHYLQTNDSSNVTSLVNESSNFSCENRLDVYQYAFYSRLIGAVGDEYPALKALLQKEFKVLMAHYLLQHPNQSTGYDDIGYKLEEYFLKTQGVAKTFADFLKLRGARSAESSYDESEIYNFPFELLLEMIRFEVNINQVFDCVTTEEILNLKNTLSSRNKTLDLNELQQDLGEIEKTLVLEKLQQGLLSEIQVSCSRLFKICRFEYPVAKIYNLLKSADNVKEACAQQPQETYVCFYHINHKLKFDAVTKDEAQLLKLIGPDDTLQDWLVKIEAAQVPAENLNQQLQYWIEEKIIHLTLS